MAPQETHFLNMIPDDSSPAPTVILHVFGTPASDFTKNMGILHARNQAKAGYEIDIRLVHRYALVHPQAFWSFPQDLSEEEMTKRPKMELALAIQKIRELNVTMAVIHVHTTDCNYKTLFKLLQIPENLLQMHNLSFPLVVKPTRMEASVGVILVHTVTEMVDALTTSFSYGDSAIVDTFIAGREVCVGVVSRREEELEKLTLIEYNISHTDIRGMEKKVDKDGKNLVNLPNHFWYIQEEDDPTLHAAMHEVACKAHTALGCRDFSFIDCR